MPALKLLHPQTVTARKARYEEQNQGTATMKDGKKMMMKEGNMMSKDGEIMKHDAKEHGH